MVGHLKNFLGNYLNVSNFLIGAIIKILSTMETRPIEKEQIPGKISSNLKNEVHK